MNGHMFAHANKIIKKRASSLVDDVVPIRPASSPSVPVIGAGADPNQDPNQDPTGGNAGNLPPGGGRNPGGNAPGQNPGSLSDSSTSASSTSVSRV